MNKPTLFKTMLPATGQPNPSLAPICFDNGWRVFLADDRPKTTRAAWLETTGLLAAATAGTVGLVRLAYHVTTAHSSGNGGVVVYTEVISLWMHPALFELAQHPADIAERQSLDAFRRYAEQRRLEKAWYVITAKSFQTNGNIEVNSTIRRPYEMIEPYYPEFLGILAIAAANPPQNPSIDFTKAKVRVIPKHLLDADPRAVLDELRMLEELPGHRTAGPRN